MPQTTVTSAFNRYKAQEAAGGRRVVLDEFVFANIPGLDAGNLPPDSEGMPDEEYIV
ncbi:phage tail protein, partial [Salmonella enterica]|nr:phage tail protein [Salmonella enterica]